MWVQIALSGILLRIIVILNEDIFMRWQGLVVVSRVEHNLPRLVAGLCERVPTAVSQNFKWCEHLYHLERIDVYVERMRDRRNELSA